MKKKKKVGRYFVCWLEIGKVGGYNLIVERIEMKLSFFLFSTDVF